MSVVVSITPPSNDANGMISVATESPTTDAKQPPLPPPPRSQPDAAAGAPPSPALKSSLLPSVVATPPRGAPPRASSSSGGSRRDAKGAVAFSLPDALHASIDGQLRSLIVSREFLAAAASAVAAMDRSTKDLSKPLRKGATAGVGLPPGKGSVGRADMSSVAAAADGAGSVQVSVATYLLQTPHFCTVSYDALSNLSAAMVREYAALDTVVIRGSPLQHVYAVVSGSVEVFMTGQTGGMEKRVGTVTSPGAFGLESIILDTPATFTARAGTKSTLILIPKEGFLSLLRQQGSMAQSVGHHIVTNMDLSAAFDSFCRAVFASNATAGGVVDVHRILQEYSSLVSVHHPLADAPMIDVQAWRYALQRLPVTITETFSIVLTRSLPPSLVDVQRQREEAMTLKSAEGPSPGSGIGAGLNMAAAPHSTVPSTMASVQESSADEGANSVTVTFVPSVERRRTSWQLGAHGQLYVVVREGYTDVLDFVTCFCMHTVEARKLRRRLNTMVCPTALESISRSLMRWNDAACRIRSPRHHHNHQTSSLSSDRQASDEVTAIVSDFLAGLPLSDEERQGLYHIWGPHTIHRVRDIFMVMNDAMSLTIDTSVSRRFHGDPYIQWALNLRRVVLACLGLRPNSMLPRDVSIDILSSNSLCAKNLLCGFVRKYVGPLTHLQQERRIHPTLWRSSADVAHAGNSHETPLPDDLLYYMASQLIAQDESWRLTFRQELKTSGFTVMEDAGTSGLQADVLDLDQLSADLVDTELRHALGLFQGGRGDPQSTTRSPVAIATSNGGSAFVDSTSKAHCQRRRRFLINMDFAFGAQADGITRALILTFQDRIQSLNVFGKAAGLQGNRGDVLLPTTIVFSKSVLGVDNVDECREAGNRDIDEQRLRQLLGAPPSSASDGSVPPHLTYPPHHPQHKNVPLRRQLHKGPVVTIPGALLQTTRFLNYYNRIHGCVGVDMEAAYYARQVEESTALGLFGETKVKTRFAYYTGELPLSGNPALITKSMEPHEGIPAMYAVARVILEAILRDSGAGGGSSPVAVRL